MMLAFSLKSKQKMRTKDVKMTPLGKNLTNKLVAYPCEDDVLTTFLVFCAMHIQAVAVWGALIYLLIKLDRTH